MQRTEGERALMAFRMLDLARTLMTAGIRADEPGISDSQLRVRIFERTYGSEFDDRERARIALRIARSRIPDPSLPARARRVDAAASEPVCEVVSAS